MGRGARRGVYRWGRSAGSVDEVPLRVARGVRGDHRDHAVRPDPGLLEGGAFAHAVLDRLVERLGDPRLPVGPGAHGDDDLVVATDALLAAPLDPLVHRDLARLAGRVGGEDCPSDCVVLHRDDPELSASGLRRRHGCLLDSFDWMSRASRPFCLRTPASIAGLWKR